MAEFTKKAIRNSFIKLLNEKPLKQISVRDIVDDCGINRNTFYYHFQDIPQLLASIIKEDSARIIAEHPQLNSVEECLDAIIKFSLDNRKAVLHIYRSVNRDLYEQYQWQICEYAVKTYMDSALKGRKISDPDREIITEYMKCVLFGLIMDWLERGMQNDVKSFTHRICQLKLGTLDEMITLCEQK